MARSGCLTETNYGTDIIVTTRRLIAPRFHYNGRMRSRLLLILWLLGILFPMVYLGTRLYACWDSFWIPTLIHPNDIVITSNLILL